MKAKHLIQIAAVLLLSTLNLQLSTALASTNPVGVITASYTMTANGTGTASYGSALAEGYNDSDQITLSISGTAKYEVLQTETNLVIGNLISSTAAQMASGIWRHAYWYDVGEFDGCTENWTDSYASDPQFNPTNSPCVWIANSQEVGQFVGGCGGVSFGTVDANGVYSAFNTSMYGALGYYDGQDGCQWESLFSSGCAGWGAVSEEGAYYALEDEGQVGGFRFAFQDSANAWNQTITTNSTLQGSTTDPAGLGTWTWDATATNTVTLGYEPYQLTVPFTADPTNGPVPLAVQFSCTNMDSGTNDIVSWLWSFGDGTTDTNQAPSHTYTNTNTFSVTLTAININGKAVQGIGPTNIVVALPTVQFTAWPTNGYMPLLVEFSCPAVDSGTNSIVSWLWYFGDGPTSTNQNPSYIYTSSKPKTFSPKLYATNVNGTAVVATGPKIYAAYPPIGFNASPTNGLVPLPVQFNAPAADTLGVTITNWTWTFGDGAASVLQSPFHTYTNAGIFSPTLLTTNQNHIAIIGFGPNISAGCSSVHTFGVAGVGFDPTRDGMTNSDGIHPQAALTVSGNRLYGVMSGGGNGGSGTIFAVNTDGSGFTNLYSFSAPPGCWYTNGDGESPRARLVLSGNTLYGAASSGGSGGGTSFMGQGTVFKINTDGSGFATLFNFPDGSDGGTTPNGLVLSSNTLYGTTGYGGSGGDGTVFKIATDGSGFTRIHDFSASAHDPSSGSQTNGEGACPQAPLLLAGNSLYGTTMHGGASGGGTLFKLNTDGSGLCRAPYFHEERRPPTVRGTPFGWQHTVWDGRRRRQWK